ncbi:MAG: ABC transporter substrate-binding protein [Solirubrobacterales bacterium]|nr:ABC transporter substrate-binding protein [Solirubrobacterales bacterium]OJU95900.1 MAG: hypothetical protein BGO23_10000 [Solirubrobacterales bacterium 67-14]
MAGKLLTRLALLAALLSIATFEAACGSAGDSTGTGSGSGGTINVALNSGIATLDPAYGCFPQYDYWIIKNTYDTLVQYGSERDQNGQAEIKPSLAKNWKISDDGKTYTFNLRDDVKFASGNPMTAADVVYGFERLMDKGGCADYVLRLGDPKAVESVTATGKHQVTFRINRPSPIFLGQLTQTGLSPIDRKQLQANGGLTQKGDNWMASHTIGTGAYEVTSYQPDSQIVLKARDDYWQGKPENPGVNVRIVSDPTTLNTLVQSNEVDLAYGIHPKDVDRLAEGRQSLSQPGPWYIYLGLNTKKAPFDDIKLRQAARLALDRPAMADELAQGHATLVEGPMPPTMPFRPDIPLVEQNVDEARKMVSEAGAEGTRVTIDVKAGDQLESQVAEVIQSSLNEVGFDVTVAKLGTSAFYGKGGGFKSQAYLSRDGTPFNDPAYYLGFQVKCGNAFNWTQYCDKRVDHLLEVGRNSQDPEVRRKAYGEISEIATRDAALIPIFGVTPNVIGAKSLHGFVAYDDLEPVFWPMSVSG